MIWARRGDFRLAFPFAAVVKRNNWRGRILGKMDTKIPFSAGFEKYFSKIFEFRKLENGRKREKTREKTSFHFLNRFEQKKFSKKH